MPMLVKIQIFLEMATTYLLEISFDIELLRALTYHHLQHIYFKNEEIRLRAFVLIAHVGDNDSNSSFSVSFLTFFSIVRSVD